MIKVRINKKIYRLPISSIELTLDQGMQLISSLKLEDQKSLDYKRSVLAILLNCDVDLLTDVPDYKIEVLHEKIPLLYEKQIYYHFDAFKLKGKLFGLIDFNQITVIEYMELCTLFEEESENLDKVLSILYREIVYKKQNLKNILINIATSILFKTRVKPYKCISFKTEEYKEQDNDDLFRHNFNYAFSQGTVVHFLEWKKRLEQEFWQIFDDVKNPNEEEEYDPFEILEEQNKQNRRDEPSIGEKWGLFHIVFEICDGDKIQMDYWKNKPIRELFTHVTYIKHRNAYIEKSK